MRTHQEIEERSLALAKAIAARIDADPDRAGLRKAQEVLARWLTTVAAPDLDLWREILERPWGEIRDTLLDPSERGRRLRQSSPFCGVLTPKERWAIWRKYRVP